MTPVCPLMEPAARAGTNWISFLHAYQKHHLLASRLSPHVSIVRKSLLSPPHARRTTPSRDAVVAFELTSLHELGAAKLLPPDIFTNIMALKGSDFTPEQVDSAANVGEIVAVVKEEIGCLKVYAMSNERDVGAPMRLTIDGTFAEELHF